MSIIEKLKIKELKVIPCSQIKTSEICDYTAVEYELLKKREREYREMIKALIQGILMIENLDEFIQIDSDEYSFRDNAIDIIEKACYPKTWKEIKELL